MTNSDEPVPQEKFFHLSRAGDSPWEIGRPQPEIIKLTQRGIFHGRVLDVGCGIGDNAIYIAAQVKDVELIAIDLVSVLSIFFRNKLSPFQAPKAVEVSRKKAEQQSLNIKFGVVDMLSAISTTTDLEPHSFDVILDSAIFHNFSDEERLRYRDNLRYLIKPGGLYIQLCFGEKETRHDGPRLVKKEDIRALFSSNNGWTIESIEDVIYECLPDAPIPDARFYLSFIRQNTDS